MIDWHNRENDGFFWVFENNIEKTRLCMYNE